MGSQPFNVIDDLRSGHHTFISILYCLLGQDICINVYVQYVQAMA